MVQTFQWMLTKLLGGHMPPVPPWFLRLWEGRPSLKDQTSPPPKCSFIVSPHIMHCLILCQVSPEMHQGGPKNFFRNFLKEQPKTPFFYIVCTAKSTRLLIFIGDHSLRSFRGYESLLTLSVTTHYLPVISPRCTCVVCEFLQSQRGCPRCNCPVVIKQLEYVMYCGGHSPLALGSTISGARGSIGLMFV